ncbi:hypothetical protein BGZ88_000264 [Linnemannia elongata]|nr:hypothetical protein BGZ88_000264 [Linnemannia elongata]
MPFSSPSYTPRGDTNNDRLNTLTSHSSKDEYDRIYTRDSETYADCAYDSGHQDHCVSEEDSDEDDNNYISFALPLSQWTKSKRRNRAFGLKTYKGEHVEIEVIQPLIESPNLPELPDEVLELVCTYLSRATLRYSVNLVCKKWHEVSDHFIRRAGICKPVEGALELLLSRWPRISSLALWFDQDELPFGEPGSIITKPTFWNAFVAAIMEPKAINRQKNTPRDDGDDNTDTNGNGDTDPSALSCLLHTIRHLELGGQYLNYTQVAYDFRGHLQFIESLTITISSPMSILLFTILEEFSALRSLNLIIRIWWKVYLTHGDDEDKNEAMAIVVDDSPKMFPERYQLQRFCVNDICTDLKVLERLLVTCTKLRVFNAKDIEVGLTGPQEGSDIDEEEVRAAIIAEERRARQRLIDLAAKHCPKLEWYSFHTPSADLDKEDLRDKARSFPDLKMQSVSLTGYLDAVFDDALGVRGLLEDISVLELHSTVLRDEVDALHRILCLTPNLLHLIAPNAYLNTSNLWKPPAPVVKFTKRRVFTTLGNRKRHHRNVRRRRAREQALTDPRSTAPAADIGTSVAIIDPLIPVTWQVHSLKTLELSLHHSSSLVDFADYIFRYRLFRDLVILTLKIWDLKVGQRQSLRKVSAAAPAAETLIEPARYPNELLGLRSLRCLEECTLRAENVPGMISVKNFKFLKRTESFKTVSFLPFRMNGIKWKETRGHRNNKSVLERMAAINDDDDDDDEDDEKDVDNGEEEKEEDKKGLRDETFWPKLSTFQISYRNISTGTDTRKLVRRLQHLRPGVAFSIQSHTSF